MNDIKKTARAGKKRIKKGIRAFRIPLRNLSKSFRRGKKLIRAKNGRILASPAFARTIAAAVAFSLLVSMLGGGPAIAATYIFSQQSWSSGVSPAVARHSNDQEGWSMYSALSGVRVVNAGSGISMVPASISFAETFSSLLYQDAVNSTANWNTVTGQLEMAQETGIDLSSKFASVFGAATIQTMAYAGGNIYAGTGTGKFARYSVAADSATDLTSRLSAWSIGGINALAYDSANQAVYIAGSSGKFGKYSAAADTATDLTSKISLFWGTSAIQALTYDSHAQSVYIGGASGKFAKYAIGADTATNLTSKISSFWSTNSVLQSAYDTANRAVYIGGDFGKFARYVPASDTATDLTSKISSFWGTSFINGVAYDSANQAVYIGGTVGKFAKYAIGADTATNLTSKISSFWSTANIQDIVYDQSGLVYLGGDSGRIAKYAPASDTATNLISKISAFWGSVSITSLAYDPASYALYTGGSSAKFGRVAAACSTCVGQSLSIDATGQNILSATLLKNDVSGSGSVEYYLSNDGATYVQVAPGVLHAFATTGSDLRFRAVLSGNAAVQDISVSYSYYDASGTLTSSVFDSEDPGNVLGGVSWTEDAAMPDGAGVSLSLRTGATADGILLSPWTSLTGSSGGCTRTDGMVACDSSAVPASMKMGGDDRYFQYQVALTSGGLATAAVSNVAVTYVVNARPEFDASYYEQTSSGAIASQVTNPASENIGKVFIQYRIRDTDTALGSATPGYVTPSFEYDAGSGWQPVGAAYLRQADTENKPADASSYAEYSALWDVKSQIPGRYAAAARIRVTINDNEGANNTATAETPAFVLDTSDPSIGTLTVDSSSDTITFSADDDTSITYRLANSEDFSDAGEWVEAGSGLVNATIADWSLPGGSGAETVYVEAKDGHGNRAVASGTAPAAVQNLDLRDVGNVLTAEFREFLAWGLYATQDGAAFSAYEIYRSTDGVSYGLLSSISDINQNYYTDSAVTNTGIYYYKVRVIDADGDRSGYSAIVSDTPDGQGGTDFTPPTIEDVDVEEIQTTWARIAWTTDEISDSAVEYSPSPSTAFGTRAASTALVRDHSVVIDGLSPNTEYFFQVESTDVLSNLATDSNSGEGYSFTTAGGPSISGVAIRNVDDNTATIVWNTDRSANSFVVFAGEVSDLENGTNTAIAGSAEYVGEPFEHSVTLTGLVSKSTYYFYVKSADAETGYESVDNRSGRYYTFNTTNDQKAPTISDIQAPIIAPNAASITWRTDELADSLVEYGTTEGEYSLSSSRDSTMSIYHVITLSGLEPVTKYYIRVSSTDSADNKTEAFSSFTTPSELRTVYQSSGGGGSSDKDTTPPRIGTIEAKDETSFGATIAFETSEDTVAFVNFGDEAQYGRTVGSSAFASAHEVKLFGLRSGNEYNFEIKVFDKAGNMGASTNRTFQTKFVTEAVDELVILDNMEEFQDKIEGLIESTMPSLIPPVISDIEVTNVTDTSADISWKTNVKAYSVVALVRGDRFDITSEDPYEFEMSDVEQKVKDHRLTLQSLEPGTKYHFQVKSFSIPGVVGKSRDYNFATRAASARAGAVKTTNNSFTISWQTADPATSFVEYKNLKTGKVAEIGSKELTRNHIVEVSNLPAATTFEMKYYGYTLDGVKIEGAPMRVTTQIDTTAPALSDVSISSAFIPYRPNQLQTLISWKTDEPANSIVEYEEGPGSSKDLANKEEHKDEYTKEHIVILPGFKPGTIYRVRITSSDAAGNSGVVPTRTIITPVASDTVFEIIIKNFEDVFGFLKNLK